MRNPIHLRILPDEDGMHYCGYFPGGYSSVGKVGVRSLEDSIKFYFRILRSEMLLRSEVQAYLSTYTSTHLSS